MEEEHTYVNLQELFSSKTVPLLHLNLTGPSPDDAIPSSAIAERADLRNHWIMTRISIKQFRCKYKGCGKMLAEGKMARHVAKVHQCTTPIYSCRAIGCDVICRGYEAFADHLDEHHLALWPCRCCRKVFESYEEVKQHTMYAHVQGRYACTWKGCRYEDDLMRSVGEHIKQVHLPTLVDCTFTYCGQQFESQAKLRDHEFKQHGMKKPSHKWLWIRRLFS